LGRFGVDAVCHRQLEIVVIRIDDVYGAGTRPQVFGGEPEQFGQRVVEVVAASRGRSRSREQLAIGSFAKRSFARHNSSPCALESSPGRLYGPAPTTATPRTQGATIRLSPQ